MDTLYCFAVRAVLLAGASLATNAWAITPTELAARLKASEPLLIVDVRASAAYADGHIPGAINIPASLLPHKTLPTAQLIVVYGDGLGVVNEASAVAAVRAKPGAKADVLQGGYVAWVAETRLSTESSGLTKERIPGITYQQLVAAAKTDVVLVDLRKGGATAASTAPTTAAAVKGGAPARAAAAAPVDLVRNFGAKLGVPVVAADTAQLGSEVATAARARAASGAPPARAASSLAVDPNKLLVLVADDETEANAVARELRARGNYRFTVLIGGTEIIRHEGRTGMGRMDGDLPVTKSQP